MRGNILVLAVLLSMLPLAASAQLSASGALSLYSLQVSPNPIVAGSNIIITFQLYNTYSYSLQNVNLELEGEYPILNFSPSKSYLINSVGQGLYGGSNVYFTYHLSIPKDTPSGSYTLTLLGTYQTSQTNGGVTETVTSQSSMPITFYVHGIPNITITSTNPSISPGTASTITFSVMNSGYGTARNVSIELLNSSIFRPTGTKVFSLGSLAPGAPAQITAGYMISSNMTNGTYYIPLQVRYTDEVNSNAVYNHTINVATQIALNNPDIVAVLESTSPQALYSGYNQSMMVVLENVGTGLARNVSLNLNSGAGASVISSVNHFFIGTIPAGGSATETVLVSAASTQSGSSYITANLSYLSSNYKNQFTKSQQLNISIAPAASFNFTQGKYTLKAGQTDVPVTYRITNTGNVEAEEIQLNFQSQFPLTPITNSYYIPGLMPGQSANITFDVSVDSSATSGTFPVVIYEQWKQPNGAAEQTYTGSNNYYAEVSGTSGGLGGYTVAIIVVVIIVVAVIVVMKRMNSKKAKK